VIESHFESHDDERGGDAADAFARDLGAVGLVESGDDLRASDVAGPIESAPRGEPIETLAARRFGEMLEFDARLFEHKGLRLLTPEARVLFYLADSGPVSVTAATKVAGTSYRAFYAVLARLKDAGLVNTRKDARDQRIRKLSVDRSLSTALLHP
jgi:DNA-binding transcriptional ArsR family regulator